MLLTRHVASASKKGRKAMTVRVFYSTDASVDRTGNTAKQIERDFPSLDEAKAATVPHGYTFACIFVETGRWVWHSPAFVWEFQPENG
jgi:hypothetical protein